MKNLLEYILIHLVDYPEDIQITEEATASGNVVYTIKANPADYGRIIGKNGSMISSIRNIMTVRAIKEQKRVTVIVDSEDKPSEGATVSKETVTSVDPMGEEVFTSSVTSEEEVLES